MRRSNAEFEFLSLLGKFFTEYLPISMNASPNTIHLINVHSGCYSSI